MDSYILSVEATEDLIRIRNYGAAKFGLDQADKYYDNFYKCFEMIAQRPYSYESVRHIRKECRRCVCGSDVIYFIIKDQTVFILSILGQQDRNKFL